MLKAPNFASTTFTNLAVGCARVVARPKDKHSAVQCRGVVYKVGYRQINRALEIRLKERKTVVRVGDNNSKVAQHTNQFGSIV